MLRQGLRHGLQLKPKDVMSTTVNYRVFLAFVTVVAVSLPLHSASGQIAPVVECSMDAMQVAPETKSPGTAMLRSEQVKMLESLCDSITYEIHYDKLQSDPTGLRLHRGPVGENGELLEVIFDGKFESGATFRLSLNDHCEDFWNDLLYATITTNGYPDGEVRGQLKPGPTTPTISNSWGATKWTFTRPDR